MLSHRLKSPGCLFQQLMTSHLNLKKLTSHDHVHDHANSTENSQGYIWTDQWIYLDRSKTDDDSIFGQICHDHMKIRISL